jgi:ribosomal protein S27E
VNVAPKCECCGTEMEYVGKRYCPDCGHTRFHVSKDRTSNKCASCGGIFSSEDLPTRLH